MTAHANAFSLNRAALAGIPQLHIPTNFLAALKGGRRHWQIFRDVVKFRRGPGKLTPQEYFYYRLWEAGLPEGEGLRFVGKQAQDPMHRACNYETWYGVTQDKLLFHALMQANAMPSPRLLAVIGDRRSPGTRRLHSAHHVANCLRDPGIYPAFAKPIDGTFSLGAYKLEGIDAAAEDVLTNTGPMAVTDLAETLAQHKEGYLIQGLLEPHAQIRRRYGDRLWSVRFLVLLTADGPVIHRTVVKIAAGRNVADNFWRAGNLLAAVDASGRIRRVIQGTGHELAVLDEHPDTVVPLVGWQIPDFERAADLCLEAARLLPGVKTQSWDVTLTDEGPVILEVNWGGDLNLHQLAWGRGVLDEQYRSHLSRCGYRF